MIVELIFLAILGLALGGDETQADFEEDEISDADQDSTSNISDTPSEDTEPEPQPDDTAPDTTDDQTTDPNAQDDTPPDTLEFIVEENEDGSVTIDLAEGQSGQLIAIKHFDTYYNLSNGKTSSSASLGFYHLPENQTFGVDGYGGQNRYTLDDVIAENGLTLITEFDLGSKAPGEDVPDWTESPTLNVPEGTPIYRVESQGFDIHVEASLVQIDETFSPFEEVVPAHTGTSDLEMPPVDFTVSEDDDGTIAISLDEGQTGSIIALKIDSIDYDSTTAALATQLQFYHLPETQTFTTDPVWSGQDLTFESVIDQENLTLLATFDLGEILYDRDNYEGSFTTQDNRVEPPSISVPQDIPIYRLQISEIDGHTYNTVLQEDETFSPFEEVIPTHFGVPAIDASDGITNGTNSKDWIIASENSQATTLNGLGEDDRIEVGATDISVFGGSGDDRITGLISQDRVYGGLQSDLIDSTVHGDAGDDDLWINSGASAYGGNGDDAIWASSDTDPVLAYGGEGGDQIYLGGFKATGYGGADNDTFNIGKGATGYGGSGNDYMNPERNGTAFGGDGDDRFHVVNFFRDEGAAPEVTGGAGSDRFEALVRNPVQDETIDYLHIADFDIAEDVLVVGAWGPADVVSIDAQEAADGSHTIVTIEFGAQSQGGSYLDGPSYATIRLDGVTDFDLNTVVIQ